MKVTVRVAHSRSCPNATKSAVESVDAACRRSGCSPSYYRFHRDESGRVIKGPRVKDKKAALEEAARFQRDLDIGRLGIQEAKRATFPQWLEDYERFLASAVAKGDLKPRTEREYVDSLRRSKDAIGHVDLRRIGAADLQRVDDANASLAVSSRARHLKQLSVCLSRAVDFDYLDRNPVPPFLRTLKLNSRIPKRGKAGFEDGELARLWPALDDKDAPVYRYLCEFAVETGMRIGELAALDWENVSLNDKVVKVKFTYNATDGLIAPKDREERDIFLTPFAQRTLEAWVAIVGVRESGPVFPDPLTGGRLSIRAAQRRLEKAMGAAGISKQHPQLGLKRSFHSLRYSTSNLLQRRGYHPRYIESILGHSSLELTYGVYGGWSPDQLAAEAARITE